MSEPAHISEQQKADIRQYLRDVALGNDHFPGVLYRPLFQLIAQEEELLIAQLDALKFERAGDDILFTLPDYALRSIIREAGVKNGRRVEGTRPAKFWLQLLCTLELCTAYEAEQAYQDVFNTRIEVNKLSDEDLEFAMHPPDSFYKIRDIQPQPKIDTTPTHRVTVYPKRTRKPAELRKLDYMRQLDAGGEPSKLALDNPACRLPLLPDYALPDARGHTNDYVPPPLLPKNNPELAESLENPRWSLHLHRDAPLFDNSRRVKKRYSDRGPLHPDMLFDRRPDEDDRVNRDRDHETGRW